MSRHKKEAVIDGVEDGIITNIFLNTAYRFQVYGQEHFQRRMELVLDTFHYLEQKLPHT